MICLCLNASSMDENYRLIARYDQQVDLFELRYDCLAGDEPLQDIGRHTSRPVIFTLRLPEDGGKRVLQGPRDLELFRKKYLQAARAGYRYLDLQLPAGERQAQWAELIDGLLAELEHFEPESRPRIIRSLHFMQDQPAGLDALYARLKAAPGDVRKLALTPGSTADLLELFRFADSLEDDSLVLLGMGEYGFCSRVLAARLGSLWTYCTADGLQKAAPGQLKIGELLDVYRYRSIRADDRIFCVIGNPVMHSRSPHLHNPALRALGLKAVYVPIPVDNLDAFFSLAAWLSITGVSVTIPFKEEVGRFCASLSADVKASGACNTLVQTDGIWQGHNTDIDGFLTDFMQFCGWETLAGRRITVLGAGGAGRAVVHGLVKAGAEVLVANRSLERAASLAAAFGVRHCGLGPDFFKQIAGYSQAIVQTSSAGMHPLEALDPLVGYAFTGRECVYDIVFNPPVTRFLQAAQKAGCRVANGQGMLYRQARLQFELFTGRSMPEPESDPEPEQGL